MQFGSPSVAAHPRLPRYVDVEKVQQRVFSESAKCGWYVHKSPYTTTPNQNYFLKCAFTSHIITIPVRRPPSHSPFPAFVKAILQHRTAVRHAILRGVIYVDETVTGGATESGGADVHGARPTKHVLWDCLVWWDVCRDVQGSPAPNELSARSWTIVQYDFDCMPVIESDLQ